VICAAPAYNLSAYKDTAALHLRNYSGRSAATFDRRQVIRRHHGSEGLGFIPSGFACDIPAFSWKKSFSRSDSVECVDLVRALRLSAGSIDARGARCPRPTARKETATNGCAILQVDHLQNGLTEAGGCC